MLSAYQDLGQRAMEQDRFLRFRRILALKSVDMLTYLQAGRLRYNGMAGCVGYNAVGDSLAVYPFSLGNE